MCYLNNYFGDNFCDNHQFIKKKVDIDTKIKTTKRESKNIL